MLDHKRKWYQWIHMKHKMTLYLWYNLFTHTHEVTDSSVTSRAYFMIWSKSLILGRWNVIMMVIEFWTQKTMISMGLHDP